MADGPMTPAEYKAQKWDIYKTTIILSIITIVEVLIAVAYELILIKYHGAPREILMVFVAVASLVKAYWIMAVFMHVKHETKGFILTIILPFSLLIWAIIAFLYEGSSWKAMQGIMDFLAN